MPTYLLTSPDGTKYRVSGEGTGEEALAQLQSQLSASPTSTTRDSLQSAFEAKKAEQSIGSRLGENYDNRIKQMSGIADQYVAGDIGMPEAAVRQGLKYAQLLPDAAGSVIAAATPDFVKEPLTNAITSIADTAPVRSAIGAANDFSQNHPVAAGRIGSVLDAGNLLAPFAQVGGKSAVNAATDVVTTAANKALPVAAKLQPTLGADQSLLQNMGVRLTSGQRGGAFVKSIEDKATSIPGVGDVISSARTRGLDDFNRGVVNEVTSSVGAKLPKTVATGSDAVSYAQDKIGAAYDAILPKMTGNANDPDFMNNLSSALGKKNLLPDAKAKQVDDIVSDALLKRVNQSGMIIGQDNKEVLTRLKTAARNYSSSADPDQRLMGDILNKVSNSYSAMLLKNNPAQLGKELANADFAYAKLVRLQKAAVSSAGNGGVFTPSQLMSAVKQSDKSVRKSAIAKGDGLLQDIALAGQRVLPSKVPDSGTAGRLALATVLGGGLGYINPAALVGGALAAGLYTRPAQAVLSGASKIIRKNP